MTQENELLNLHVKCLNDIYEKSKEIKELENRVNWKCKK